jgi:hypothetical protein
MGATKFGYAAVAAVIVALTGAAPGAVSTPPPLEFNHDCGGT